jgi:hypothetical protein
MAKHQHSGVSHRSDSEMKPIAVEHHSGKHRDLDSRREKRYSVSTAGLSSDSFRFAKHNLMHVRYAICSLGIKRHLVFCQVQTPRQQSEIVRASEMAPDALACG